MKADKEDEQFMSLVEELVDCKEENESVEFISQVLRERQDQAWERDMLRRNSSIAICDAEKSPEEPPQKISLKLRLA